MFEPGIQKYAYGPKNPYDVCAYFDPAYGYAPYHTLGGRGFNQKSMWKKFLHSTKFKCTCVRFRYYNSSNAFFEPLVLCWNIYFWNKQSSLGITYYDHYEALQSVIANDLTCTSFLLKIRLILVRMFQSCFDFKQEKNVLQQQNNELIYPFLNLDELK